MILQTIERVATWLANGTNGVNAILPNVPRIGSDTQPANVTILDERQHGAAARGQFKRDQSFPVLEIQLEQDIDFNPAVDFAVRDAHVPILIAYATKNQDSAAAARDSYYTLVAVERSLKLLWTAGLASDRTQGTISLVYPVSVKHKSLYTPLVDTLETAGIVATYYVRDSAP